MFHENAKLPIGKPFEREPLAGVQPHPLAQRGGDGDLAAFGERAFVHGGMSVMCFYHVKRGEPPQGRLEGLMGIRLER